MGAQGQKRPEHGVQPAPVGALIDDLGRLDRVKPEDGPHRVHHPTGMKVGGPDIRVDKGHYGPGMGDLFGHHQVIQEGPHGRAFAQGSVLLVRRQQPGRGKDLDLRKGIGQAAQAFRALPPEGDPDLIDEGRKSGCSVSKRSRRLPASRALPRGKTRCTGTPAACFSCRYRL